MALQKTITIGGVNITDALHVVEEIYIINNVARVSVVSYKDNTEMTAGNKFGKNKKYIAKDAQYTTYFNTPNATKTIKEMAQDFLKNEIAEFSGATII